MKEDSRIHVDARGRVFVENASAEILEALSALGWTNRAATRVTVEIGDNLPKPHTQEA